MTAIPWGKDTESDAEWIADQLARRREHWALQRVDCIRRAHREERSKEELAHYLDYSREQRELQLTHREELAAKQRVYRLAHREELAAKSRAYRLAHREELAAQRAGRKRKGS